MDEKARQASGLRACALQPDVYPPNVCAVCHSATPELGNAIIKCRSCGLHVHEACYGVSVPALRQAQAQAQAQALQAGGADGEALQQRADDSTLFECRVCEAGLDQVECCLCPRTGGMFKRTTNGE